MKRKPVIVYKVVSGIGPWYRSFIVSRRGIARHYRVGHTTRSLFGGLLCFTEEFRARGFGGYNREGAILRCEASSPMDLPTFRVDYDCVGKHVRAILANAWAGIIPEDLKCTWPRGTVAYKEVKPLEVVK